MSIPATHELLPYYWQGPDDSLDPAKSYAHLGGTTSKMFKLIKTYTADPKSDGHTVHLYEKDGYYKILAKSRSLGGEMVAGFELFTEAGTGMDELARSLAHAICQGWVGMDFPQIEEAKVQARPTANGI